METPLTFEIPYYGSTGIKSIDTVDVNDFIIEINSIDDFKDFFQQNILIYEENKITGYGSLQYCDELKDEINKSMEKRIVLKFFKDICDNFLKMMKSRMYDFSCEEKNKYNELTNVYVKIIKGTHNKSTKFILDNKDEVFNIINEITTNELIKIKNKRAETNKKYYEKRKALLGIKDKNIIPLTEEEKNERKKLANKKYYEKQKDKLAELKPEKIVLTEEQKIENKKIANAKYREKQKLLKEQSK